MPDPKVPVSSVPSMGRSLRTVKLKINGRCMNRCCFCVFNNRSEQLEDGDVSRLLRVIGKEWKGLLVINGGEPTIHPRFQEISYVLAGDARANRRGVGTNLRLFERRSSQSERIWSTILDCYDIVQIGCDDEHRNLDVVEQRVPELRSAGKEVYIQCAAEFASRRTHRRLRELDDQTGSRTRFTQVTNHGNYRASDPVPPRKFLCDKRRREVLIDCDGEIFFCFQQDFSTSEGNFFQLDDTELRHLIFNRVPTEPYRSCPDCSRRSPEVSIRS